MAPDPMGSVAADMSPCTRALAGRAPRPPVPSASRSAARALRAFAGALVVAGLALASPVRSQEALDEVFQDLGTATVEDAASKQQEGRGSIAGRVFDGETGTPVEGVTIILTWPPPDGGGEPHQQVAVTDADGAYEFASVPAGSYDLDFVKAGYRSSTMTKFQVEPGVVNTADFPVPPLPTQASGEILELDAFVVEASTVSGMMDALELRMDSDVQLDIMTAEDLAKFAAGDVAEALKRVAGVNIVEGQFAIIRGLEERYSSTLFKGAVVPSPDPEFQSPQLDLFPSEIVSNLLVAKTFGPQLPGNSSGGSIDILTDFPEEPFFEFSAKAGFNDNASDVFLDYNDEAATGDEKSGFPLDTDYKARAGGRFTLFDRELRLHGIASQEIDYETQKGFQETLEPRRRNRPPDFSVSPPFLGDRIAGLPFQSGGLADGRLDLSEGQFDLVQSEWSKQRTLFSGVGIDLDKDARHKLDFTYFYTKKDEEIVQHKENGYLPNFDYGTVLSFEQSGGTEVASLFNNYAAPGAWIAFNANPNGRGETPLSGHQWYSNVNEGRGISRNRDLWITQLNGEHSFEQVEGLTATWAANLARTTQDEFGMRSRIFNTPTDPDFVPQSFPVTVRDGLFYSNEDVLQSTTNVDEKQRFARFDLEYETRLWNSVDWTMRAGGWYEKAKRTVDASTLPFPFFDQVECRTPGSQICQADRSRGVAIGRTFAEVGTNANLALQRDANGEVVGLQNAENDSERKVKAISFDTKLTFWDDFDVFGGVRIETLKLTSNNDATAFDRNGQPLITFGSPEIYPSRYLFFDRQDNPTPQPFGPGEASPVPGTTFNDQILGIDVPVDPETGYVDITGNTLDTLINGEIDEKFYLPAFALTYRPAPGMRLRAAYSQTVARPSFRELGYYVTIPVDSSQLEVGNPQLQVSEVESFDGRFEYTWGEYGDLVAFSAFYKKIDNPIEKIVLRDAANSDFTSLALFRTWFNNPNPADLWGIEVEARKNLGDVGRAVGRLFGRSEWDGGLLKYFSIGGNYTYIDAKVDRDQATLSRAAGYFGTIDGGSGEFTELDSTRRLFGQPEWIANADISFAHPEWGTNLTLAFYTISDVLAAAGTAQVAPNGQVNSFTLDEYVASFHQLDLIVSQRIWGGLVAKFTAKNLTDTSRGVIYDPYQTSGTFYERKFKEGREFKLSLSYSYDF